jgi:RimJ/RimL family protein N-acetyltransferase
MTAIPTLETNRLILRPFRVEDCEPLADVHGDPRVARFVLPEGKPQPEAAQAHSYILGSLGHWVLHGCGKWAVVEKATARFVGRTGYNDFPHDWPGLELGWTFDPRHWGKGYATEAARAALDWGFGAFGAAKILHMIDPENTPSQAVARRLCAVPGETWSGRGFKGVVWGQTREAWVARLTRAANG